MARSAVWLLLATFGSSTGSAEVLRVPGDFASLSAAVAAASPGTRIEIGPGRYSPSTTGESFPISFAGRNLEIRGAGAGRSVLHAEGRGSLFVFEAGDASRIWGLTLAGGIAARGGAVRIEDASPELSGLHFTGHRSDSGGDALCIRSGSPRVTNCLVERCGPEGPTVLVLAGNPVFERLTLHGNGGASFEIHGDSSPVIRQTIVSRPGDPRGPAVGLHVVTGAGLGVPILEANLFAGCFDGAVLVEGESSEIVDSIREDARRNGGLREGDPLFADPAAGDFRLTAASPARRFAVGGEIGAYGGPEPLRLQVTADEWADLAAPGRSLLGPSVPNPFAPTTTIPFTVETGGVVDLGIYNVLGQRIRTLHSGDLPPGEHTRVWDGRDDRGGDAPPGIYFVRVTQGTSTESMRIVLVR
ncbi:MAG: FlgD immunoglobulin-like domain containing protein [Candidatus Eiseniibacteriota bacterium]